MSRKPPTPLPPTDPHKTPFLRYLEHSRAPHTPAHPNRTPRRPRRNPLRDASHDPPSKLSQGSISHVVKTSAIAMHALS